MADDDTTTSDSTSDASGTGSAAGVTINMSEFPAIAEAVQFSSGEEMLASLGIKNPSDADTATA